MPNFISKSLTHNPHPDPDSDPDRHTKPNRDPPLSVACQEGHAEVDKARYTIDVNQAATDTGCTPLHMACQNGHAEVVSVLLDKARDTIDVNQARTDDGSGDLV